MDFIKALMKAIGVMLIIIGLVLAISAGMILAPFVTSIVILVVITLILTFMFYD